MKFCSTDLTFSWHPKKELHYERPADGYVHPSCLSLLFISRDFSTRKASRDSNIKAFTLTLLIALFIYSTTLYAQTKLATWNFEDQNNIAEAAPLSIPANQSATFSTNWTPTELNWNSAGSEGDGSFSASANNWAEGINIKYWQANVSTRGYSDITVSSKQRSTGNGPTYFKLQYSVNGGVVWFDINANIIAEDNFTSGVFTDLPLPESMQ